MGWAPPTGMLSAHHAGKFFNILNVYGLPPRLQSTIMRVLVTPEVLASTSTSICRALPPERLGSLTFLRTVPASPTIEARTSATPFSYSRNSLLADIALIFRFGMGT